MGFQSRHFLLNPFLKNHKYDWTRQPHSISFNSLIPIRNILLKAQVIIPTHPELWELSKREKEREPMVQGVIEKRSDGLFLKKKKKR